MMAYCRSLGSTTHTHTHTSSDMSQNTLLQGREGDDGGREGGDNMMSERKRSTIKPCRNTSLRVGPAVHYNILIILFFYLFI